MQMEDFKKFIDEQDALLRTTKHAGLSHRELVLTRTTKIMEEFGELCDEVLGSLGDQRAGKMEGKSSEDLADEFADVAITTFLLAKTMDINVMEALACKTEKIKAKHNQELS